MVGKKIVIYTTNNVSDKKTHLELNPFLTRREGFGGGSSRVFAFIDKIEPEFFSPDDMVSVIFDCVDARWFTDNSQRISSASEHERYRFIQEAPLSIITTQVRGRQAKLWKMLSRKGGWLVFELDDKVGAIGIVHHLGLFDPGTKRFLKRYKPTLTNGQALSQIFRIHAPNSQFAEIERVLQAAPPVSMAAVLDVGQGNCNALLKDDGTVAYYFDFGGGVEQNIRTYPKNNLMLHCFHNDPFILLSHWDWDHWSSAVRDERALDRCWIVPRQTIGAVHAAFVNALPNVLVWPETNTPWTIRGNGFTVERCPGLFWKRDPTRRLADGGGRNHTGLVLTLERDSADPATPLMLFPGDADYLAIPSVKARRGTGTDNRYVGIVVPHHGGKPRSDWAPRYPAGYARLACSVGENNSYQHPTCLMSQAHRSAGWTFLPCNKNTCQAVGMAGISATNANGGTLLTSWRSPDTGHILLPWAQQAGTPGQHPCATLGGSIPSECSQHCDLELAYL